MNYKNLKFIIIFAIVCISQFILMNTMLSQCVTGVSSSSVSFPAGGGSTGISVYHSDNCYDYSVYSTQLWCSASVNYETISFSAEANNTSEERNATVLLIDNVTQDLWPIYVTQGSSCATPILTSHPSGITLCSGQTASFSVSAYQAGSYQWQSFNGSYWSDISGANSTTYSFPTNSGMNGTSFRCVVTGSCNLTSVSNSAVLYVNALVPVSVTISGNNTLCGGEGGSFNATPVNGGTNPAYEWFKNGNLVSDNTEGVPTYVYQPTGQLNTSDYVSCRMTSNVGCASNNPATSNIITITNITPTPPSISISTYPIISGTDGNGDYLEICEGVSVNFYASSSHGGNYQWYSSTRGTIPGATGSSYTCSTLASGEVIHVVVTGLTGCLTESIATSSNLRMIVNSKVTPGVSIIPINPTICSGTNQSFTANVVYGGSPTFVWKVNGVVQSGQTGTTFSSTGFTNGQTVQVEMTAHNVCQTANTVSSNSSTVSVNALVPVSLSISGNSSLCGGQDGSFSATPVNGGTNPAYEWLKNGNPVNDNTEGVPTYVYQPTVILNTGDYISCRMTSNIGCASNNPATSNIITITNIPRTSPSVSISTYPSPTGTDENGDYLEICSGTSVIFTAESSHGGNFQWYSSLRGSIPGATGSSYTCSTLIHGEVIHVVTTGLTGCLTNNTATSSNLRMIVNTRVTPMVSITPVNPTICSGANQSFTANVVNGGSPTFVWKVNGVVQSGQTGTTFSSNGFTNGQTVQVEMTAHNVCQTANTVSSNSSTVSVNALIPVSLSISGNSSLCGGQEGSFSATPVNGGTNPAYEWLKNGNPVNDNTEGVPTYVYQPTGILNTGDYISCRMTSNVGCASNNPATSNIITITNIPRTSPSVSISTYPSPTGTDENGDYLEICSGTSVIFTAESSHGGNFQWYSSLRGSIPGATGSSYTCSTLENGEVINVVTTGLIGCLTESTKTSSNLRMIVNQKVTPDVIISPMNPTICSGTNQSFTANVVNGGSPTFVWKVNGVVQSGQTGASFSSNRFTNGQTVLVEMTAHNVCQTANTVSSNSSTVTVNTSVPVSVSISGDNELCGEQPAIFAATPENGGTNPSYEWFKNGNPVSDNTEGVPTYVYQPKGLLNTSDYVSCRMTSNVGCATNNPATSNVITITNIKPPAIPSVSITTTPSITGTDENGSYLKICSGTSVSFEANSSHGGDFQWYSSDEPISGATGSTYVSSTLVNGERIHVLVTSLQGCLTEYTKTSTDVSFRVDTKPVVHISSLSGDALGNNSSETFKADVINSGTSPSYIWILNGSVISGATSSSYTGNSWVNGSEISCVLNKAEGCSETSNIYSIVTNNIFNQTNLNFTVSNTVLKEGVSDSKSVYSLTSDDLQQSISYFDGIGRPIQNVTWQGSPLKKDNIQPITYDQFGREDKKYLPYVAEASDGTYRINAIAEQPVFYHDIAKFDLTDSAYSRIVLESSPLNRVLQQGAPGAAWQLSAGHTARIDYLSNDVSDVRLLLFDNSTGNCINTNSSYYPANSLFKTITKNENWKTSDVLLNTTEEFKDKQGQVVLKRSYVKSNDGIILPVETYYVYDDFGLLRYVIPPKAMSSVTFPVDKNSQVVRNLCYYYEYDSRNRMIMKQLPGADSVYMIYDTRDRVVLTQDGRQRLNNKWLFTKYDKFNRPLITGITTNSIPLDSLRTVIKQKSGNQLYEEFSTSDGNIHNYTNNSFPFINSADSCLTVTYYDNYLFSGAQDFTSVSAIGVTTRNPKVITKVTGGKVKILESNSWLTNTVYYDDKYRVIQTVTDNHLEGIDRITDSIDFSGKVKKSYTSHTGTQAINTTRRFEYDHAGRLVKIWHQVGTTPEILLSYMQYNELGQLVDKKIHSSDASHVQFLQSIDYRYNIRGWLTHINKPDLDLWPSDDDATVAKPDAFGMEIKYIDPFNQ